MTRNQLVIAFVVVAILVLGAASYYIFFPAPTDAIPANGGAAGYTIASDDRTLGSPKRRSP